MGRPKEITDEQITIVARRLFIERGASVSAVDIARELGVSHTTIFNRFGSKEGLMIASLRPPERVPFVAALDAGPDERAVPDQLVEHAKVMAAYFQEVHAGIGVLGAAGIDPRKVYRGFEGEPPPVQACRALVGWLERARSKGCLADGDLETLAWTILGSLHGWAFTARMCGESTGADAGGRYIERFIKLLWNGIGVTSYNRGQGPPAPADAQASHRSERDGLLEASDSASRDRSAVP